MIASADEDALRTMVLEVGETIDGAGLGLVPWLDVSRQIVEFLPDSFCWINNQNKKTGHINFAAIAGMRDEDVAAYASEYCRINPYNPVWGWYKPGEIITTEDTIPFDAIRNTEFYNEYFKKCGDFQIGLGIRIDATDIDQFVMPIHFPMVMCDRYEPLVRGLFASIEGRLRRASELNRWHAEMLTSTISAAALTGRSRHAAFVVDMSLKTIEANDKAVELFSEGRMVSVRGGQVVLNRAESQKWLQSTVASLILGASVGDSKHIYEAGNSTWLLSVFRVPERDPRGFDRFFGVKHLALVTIASLREPGMLPDGSVIADHFNLTPAEKRLCAHLVNGLTLNECADQLSLSIETVRSRLKTIFTKTRTTRQSELISLFTRA